MRRSVGHMVEIHSRQLTRRSALQWGAALGALAALGGCQSVGQPPFTLVGAELGRDPVDPSAGQAATAGLTAFTGEVLAELAGPSLEQNVAFSGLSVWLALAMTRNGALGPTAAEMDQALEFPELPVLNSGLNSLSQQLMGLAGKVMVDDEEREVSLDLISQLFGDTTASEAADYWRAPFLETLARKYAAKLALADFQGDFGAQRRKINRWVADQTNSKIVDLLPEGAINAGTRLVLVNALHFAAPWQYEFSEPEPGEFTRADGSKSTCDMVEANETFAALVSDSYTAVSVPYGGERVAMTFISPRPGREAAVRTSVTTQLNRLLAGLAPRRVRLQMPQFTARKQIEMKELLQRRGMALAFNDGADFSAMCQEALRIEDVIHQGFIQVDRYGTEAAAATAVVMRESSGPANEPLELRLDRPFWYVIHDVDSRTPIFAGYVADPAG